MINIPAGARILLATRPVDFRQGAHGLAALAQEVLAEKPFGSVQNVEGSSSQWWFLNRIGRRLEYSAKAGPERTVVDRAPNLKQQIGASSRPAHLLGLSSVD
jgi:hypothetical protein